jgi:ubiquinone/menaquinone biosynthesis C-methylase UbiE
MDSLKLQRGDALPLATLIRTQIMRRFLLIDLPYVRNGALLEVGCGSGKLLNVARAVGFECHGVEPSGDARRTLESIGCRSYPYIDDVTTSDRYFDVVVFDQSLEHIADPQGVLAVAVRLLKEGGLLVISVPNYTCNERRAFQGFWRHLDVPRHLYHFSPRAMRYIGDRFGLETVDSRFKFWGGPGVAMHMARKWVGLTAYRLLISYAYRQTLSLLRQDRDGYGQMMSFAYRKTQSATNQA